MSGGWLGAELLLSDPCRRLRVCMPVSSGGVSAEADEMDVRCGGGGGIVVAGARECCWGVGAGWAGMGAVMAAGGSGGGMCVWLM